MMINQNFIEPDWPAPSSIKAYSTLRFGGLSTSPYDSFNLATHVGDNISNVKKNRVLLQQILSLPTNPVWVEQKHTNVAIQASDENRNREADATFTCNRNQICIVLTADCLPVLLCHRKGTIVAAIHAGWRGLLNGIIKNTLSAMNTVNSELLAWLGPAISQPCFEVGDDVRALFIQKDLRNEEAFIPSENQRWLGNLYHLARLQLKNLGVNAIYGGEYCTFSDAKSFFSYRRDGNCTGRMANLIWIGGSSSI